MPSCAFSLECACEVGQRQRRAGQLRINLSCLVLRERNSSGVQVSTKAVQQLGLCYFGLGACCFLDLRVLDLESIFLIDKCKGQASQLLCSATSRTSKPELQQEKQFGRKYVWSVGLRVEACVGSAVLRSVGADSQMLTRNLLSTVSPAKSGAIYRGQKAYHNV